MQKSGEGLKNKDYRNYMAAVVSWFSEAAMHPGCGILGTPEAKFNYLTQRFVYLEDITTSQGADWILTLRRFCPHWRKLTEFPFPT